MELATENVKFLDERGRLSSWEETIPALCSAEGLGISFAKQTWGSEVL